MVFNEEKLDFKSIIQDCMENFIVSVSRISERNVNRGTNIFCDKSTSFYKYVDTILHLFYVFSLL